MLAIAGLKHMKMRTLLYINISYDQCTSFHKLQAPPPTTTKLVYKRICSKLEPTKVSIYQLSLDHIKK